MNRTMLEILLRNHEGVRNKAYTDTKGKVTVGVGRNLTDLGLTDTEVSWLVGNDIDRVLKELNAAYPWWKSLSEIRQLVLADMCFALGLTKLSKFVDFLGYLKAGNYEGAADEILDSDWARDVKGRAKNLAEMMRHDRLPASPSTRT